MKYIDKMTGNILNITNEFVLEQTNKNPDRYIPQPEKKKESIVESLPKPKKQEGV